MSARAFISYASPDRPVAQAVCEALEGAGIECWIAPRNIAAGATWSEAIVEALDSSDLVVLVFSSFSNGSNQVVRELSRAVGRRLPIVPFRVENLEPSGAMAYFIGDHQWLDAFDDPPEEYLELLTTSARRLLAPETTPIPHRAADAPFEEVHPDRW